MTRRDLKLAPPSGLSGKELGQWMSTKPTEVEIEVGGVKRKLTGRELEDWKYQRYMQDYLACVQSVDDGVGRLLEFLGAGDQVIDAVGAVEQRVFAVGVEVDEAHWSGIYSVWAGAAERGRMTDDLRRGT